MDKFETRFNEELSEVKKKLSYLQKSSVANEVLQIQNDVTQMQGQISNLSNNITSLQEVAYSGDYDDLVNKPKAEFENMFAYGGDFFHITALPNYYVIPVSTLKLQFLCATDSYVDVSFTIKYKCSYETNFTTNLNIFFNEEMIDQRQLTITNYVTNTLTVDYKVYPKQQKNYFYFVLENVSTNLRGYIESVAIDFKTSKNIFVLTRDYRKTVFVCNHKYYITENQNYVNKYHVLTAENFSLTNPQSPYYNYGPYQITMPSVTYTSAGMSIDESLYFQIERDYINQGFKFTKVLTTGNLNVYQGLAFGFWPTLFREGFAQAYSPCATAVFEAEGKLGYFKSGNNINTTVYYEYTLNGQPLDYGCWVENIAVVQVDMTNAPANIFQGSVAVRDDGQCFFIPHYNATYILPLGFGRMPSVFRQENGDIHVYLGKINNVTKLILTKNTQTNQYEVSNSSVIYGVEQYYETMDNKAIVIVDNQIKLIDV